MTLEGATEPVVELRGASLAYPTGVQLGMLATIGRRLRGMPPVRRKTVDALQNIDLTVHAGERVGIVGHNGAGKSSLLKLIARVYPPTGGSVRTSGHVHSLFDLALGFEPEATGRENILYRSLLLGETRRQIDARTPEIVEFADLGEFIDLPVRVYSAGMKVRLAFAISTSFPRDILLLDEIIGAGDKSFKDKAQARIRGLASDARTMLFASHSLGAVREMCTRAIWLRQGRIIADGPVDRVVKDYAAETAAVPVGGHVAQATKKPPRAEVEQRC